MDFNWIDGFSVKVTVQNGAVVVLANREGLLSLANHLTALAADDAPGAHFHLDEQLARRQLRRTHRCARQLSHRRSRTTIRNFQERRATKRNDGTIMKHERKSTTQLLDTKN